MIAYILEKKELTFLVRLINGADADIPVKFSDYVTENGCQKVCASLIRKGYMFKKAGGFDVEETIRFLVEGLNSAEEASRTVDGSVYVYYCDGYMLAIEQDRLNRKKCRLVPLENEAAVEEYISECGKVLESRIRFRESDVI